MVNRVAIQHSNVRSTTPAPTSPGSNGSGIGSPAGVGLAAQGGEDPEALTNDVFVAAFRSIDQFDGNEDGFVAPLFTIARNSSPTIGTKPTSVDRSAGASR